MAALRIPGAVQVGVARWTVALALLARAMCAEEPARIFVYAQRETAARAWMAVSVDGGAVADLKRGTFFAIELAPGRHSFTIEKGVPVTLEARTGVDSFVRLDWNYHVGRPPIPVLISVRPDRARSEIRLLSYIAANKVHSRSVRSGDPREPERLRLKVRQKQ